MKKLFIILLSVITLQSFGQNDFKGVNVFRDTVKTPNIIQKSIDTTSYKVDVVDALGNHYKMYWPTYGGSTSTLQQVTDAGHFTTNNINSTGDIVGATVQASQGGTTYSSLGLISISTDNAGAINLRALGSSTGRISYIYSDTISGSQDYGFRLLHDAPQTSTIATREWVTAQGYGTGGSGETNTASNANTSGVGVWYQKSGVDLQFKGINNGSSAVTVTNNTTNHTVDIDIAPENLNISSIGGTMTKSQLNAYVSDADVATIAGAETLTSKTLTSPVINSPTIGTSGTGGSAQIKTVGSIPTVAQTGAGSGGSVGVALETGSTDHAGIITITTGNASVGSTGTVTLTFNQAYTGNQPVIVLTLVKGATDWGALATVRVTTQSQSAPVLTWTNSATGAAVALTANTTYKIAYMVVGK